MLSRFGASAIIASALLAGCGGGASTTATHATHGRRLVLRPGPNGLAHLHITLRQTSVHAPTKAEIRAANAQVRAFVNKHCPCEVEQTAHGGIRLLTATHP
jgi:hypothetical protein